MYVNYVQYVCNVMAFKTGDCNTGQALNKYVQQNIDPFSSITNVISTYFKLTFASVYKYQCLFK